MSLALQEHVELGDGALCDMKKLLRGIKQALTCDNLRLIDRYIKFELEIIFKFSILGTDEDFIASFKRLKAGSGRDELAQDRIGHVEQGGVLASEGADINSTEPATNSKNQAVLVDVVKTMNDPEIVIPSLVRFCRVNEIDGSLAYPAYFSMSSGRVMLLPGIGDRKISVRAWSLPIHKYECVSEMIQSSTDVVDCITEDHGDFIRNVRYFDEVIHWASALRIALYSDFVWAGVVKVLEGAPKVHDVLFGPFYLPSNLDDSVIARHGPILRSGD